MEDITHLAVELVTKQNVKHKDIFRAISEALTKAAADLEPVPVLYNQIYGSYGFSEIFRKFMGFQKYHDFHHFDDMQFRIEAAKAIPKFGINICQIHPILEQFAAIYHQSNLQEVAAHALKIMNINNAINKVQRNLESIELYMQFEDTSTKIDTIPGRHALTSDFPCWSQYRVKSLKQLYQSDVPKLLLAELEESKNKAVNDPFWLELPDCVKEYFDKQTFDFTTEPKREFFEMFEKHYNPLIYRRRF